MSTIAAPTALSLSSLGERVTSEEPVITRLMTQALAQPDLLSLAAGFTDNATLPAALVQAALARVAVAEPSQAYLQYGMNTGRPGLRAAIADFLKAYPGEAADGFQAEDVVVTNGSQQALYISAQIFCDPGDIVLVEAPSYFVFLELLQGLGLRPVSLPMTPTGQIDVDALPALIESLQQKGDWERVKMLYFMGVYANPSSRCVELEVKRALGRCLQSHAPALPVVEDMAYRELAFAEPHSAPSVLSLPEWEGLPCAYAGTFTKPFATGMKVGFIVTTNSQWQRGLLTVKGHQDFGTSHLPQAILEDVLTGGHYTPHLQKLRTAYAAKANQLDAALHEHGLADLGWTWEKPAGGLLMWVRAPAQVDTCLDSAFWQAAMKRQVLYVPGDLCFAEGDDHRHVRLSFGALAADKLNEAARRFCGAARDVALS